MLNGLIVEALIEVALVPRLVNLHLGVILDQHLGSLLVSDDFKLLLYFAAGLARNFLLYMGQPTATAYFDSGLPWLLTVLASTRTLMISCSTPASCHTAYASSGAAFCSASRSLKLVLQAHLL